jgi:transposase
MKIFDDQYLDGLTVQAQVPGLQLANQSQIAEQAVRQIAQIYAVEREVKELSAEVRLRIRQEKSQPLVQTISD